MVHDRSSLRKLGNGIVKELRKYNEINDKVVFEVANKLNYSCDCFENDYWYFNFTNEEDIYFSGRILKSALYDKNKNIQRDLLKWLEGYEPKKNSIFFTIDNEEKKLSCYVGMYAWFKYPIYNETKEILLFEIDL